MLPEGSGRDLGPSTIHAILGIANNAFIAHMTNPLIRSRALERSVSGAENGAERAKKSDERADR